MNKVQRTYKPNSCPFILNGECDTQPCDGCFLPCEAREDDSNENT